MVSFDTDFGGIRVVYRSGVGEARGVELRNVMEAMDGSFCLFNAVRCCYVLFNSLFLTN